MRSPQRVVSALAAVLAPLCAVAGLVQNGGFEGGSQAVSNAGWSLHAGAAVELGGAFEGSSYLRIKNIGEAAKANAVTSGSIPVEPETGYVARCRYRLVGTTAHLTFGVVDERGVFVACRDFYAGIKPYWSEAILPFRTGPQNSIRTYAGRRYGQGEILFDAIDIVQDDGVEIGDVSATPNPMPEPTPEEGDRGFILSSRPWGERVAPANCPRRDDVTSAITCRLTPGEYEPLTFAVTALRELRELRVTIPADLVGPEKRCIPREHVRVGVMRSVKRWLTNSAPLQPGQRFERLPLFIFPGQPVAVSASDTQRFWLTVHAPPDTLPGRYTGSVRVETAAGTAATLTLIAEALPFRLAEPDVTYGMYYRHSHQESQFRTEAFLDRVLADMKAHGMNSFSVYADLSEKQADGTARLSRNGGTPYHYADRSCGLNWQMQKLAQGGLLQPGHPLLLLADYRFTTSVDLIRELYETRDPDWPEFLLYLVDEPHTEKQREQAKRLNALAHTVPGVRTTTALAIPGELADCYDVWIVSTSVAEFAEVYELAREKKRELWAYNCIWNGSQPLNDRYYTGLYTWWAGLRGNWQWCYTEGCKGTADFSAALNLRIPYYEDPWYATYVLPTPEANIATPGWEARREGIDDYRYLLTLKQELAKAKANDKYRSHAAVTQASRFLRETTAAARRPDAELPAALPERTYSMLLHPGVNAADCDAIRSRAVKHIVALIELRREVNGPGERH